MFLSGSFLALHGRISFKPERCDDVNPYHSRELSMWFDYGNFVTHSGRVSLTLVSVQYVLGI